MVLWQRTVQNTRYMDCLGNNTCRDSVTLKTYTCQVVNFGQGASMIGKYVRILVIGVLLPQLALTQEATTPVAVVTDPIQAVLVELRAIRWTLERSLKVQSQLLFGACYAAR